MVSLVSLELHGFLSHKDTKISFEPQERVLIDGEIGVGKTSIVEAIEWVLYEKARNKTVINFDESKASVILLLRNDDAFVKITRSINKDRVSTLSIQESHSTDGKFVTIGVSGKKNLQAWIENDLLSSPYDLFVNSIIYPQQSKGSFVSISASQRKALLLQMSGLDDLTEYYTKASDELKKRLVEISSLTTERQTIEDSLKRLPSLHEEMKEIEKRIVTLEEDLLTQKTDLAVKEKHSSSYKSVQAVYQTLLEKLTRQNSIINLIDRKIEELHENSHIKTTDQDLRSITDEIALIDEKLKKIQNDINETNVLEREIRSMVASKPEELPYADTIRKSQEELIRIKEDHLSKCILRDECLNHKDLLTSKTSYIEEMMKDRTVLLTEQTRRLEDYATRLEGLLQKKETFKSSIEEYKKLSTKKMELEGVRKVFLDDEHFRHEIAELHLKRGTAVTQVDEFEQEIQALEGELSKEKQFKILIEEIRELTSSTRDIELRIRDLSTRKGELTGTIRILSEMSEKKGKIESSIEQKRDECRKLGYVKEAFGVNGIQTIAIELLLPRIEYTANEVLSQLSDFSITFDTQKSSIDGETTIEGLFINITNPEGKVSDFSSFSGGERLAITIAISEAFASIQKIGFRIIDELFVGLDSKSVPSFIDTLKKIQGRFDQTICISHLQEVKNEFEKQILVEKIHGISSVSCV